MVPFGRCGVALPLTAPWTRSRSASLIAKHHRKDPVRPALLAEMSGTIRPVAIDKASEKAHLSSKTCSQYITVLLQSCKAWPLLFIRFIICKSFLHPATTLRGAMFGSKKYPWTDLDLNRALLFVFPLLTF